MICYFSTDVYENETCEFQGELFHSSLLLRMRHTSRLTLTISAISVFCLGIDTGCKPTLVYSTLNNLRS